MLPISIFNLSLARTSIALAGVVDDYEDASFTRSWLGVGSFSIKINYNKPFANLFERGAIILFGTDEKKVGIITETIKTVDQGGKGTQTITARGEELKTLFRQRIVYPPVGQARYMLEDVAETVMKSVIRDQAGSGAAASRAIALLSIASNLGRGSSYALSARYTNLLDELIACSTATFLGWYIYFDRVAGNFVFDCAEGVDRTFGQSVNARAIFSTDYDTIESATLTDSIVDYKNVAIVGGQGAGTARTITLVPSTGASTDIDRRELFVDARDLSSGYLTARGQSYLDAKNTVLFVDGKALTYSPLRYGIDYDLGDIVSISAFGQTTDARITEVTEHYAHLQRDIAITFGKPYPTIVSVINDANMATLNALNNSETP